MKRWRLIAAVALAGAAAGGSLVAAFGGSDAHRDAGGAQSQRAKLRALRRQAFERERALFAARRARRAREISRLDARERRRLEARRRRHARRVRERQRSSREGTRARAAPGAGARRANARRKREALRRQRELLRRNQRERAATEREEER
jgi:hypothetical protein